MSNTVLNQGKLVIYTDPDETFFFLKFCIPIIWITLIGCCLNFGLNSTTIFFIFLTATITFLIWRGSYLASKGSIILNKITNEIELHGISFTGKAEYKAFPIAQFNTIHTYNLSGRGARTLVELFNMDRSRGLVLKSYLPGCGKHFFSSPETENPLARDLAIEITTFLSIENLGFTGYKSLATTPMGIEENAELIKRLLH